MTDTPDPFNLPARPRRLRRGVILRDALAEVIVRPSDLIQPIFVRQGTGVQQPVASMPGVAQWSPDTAAAKIAALTAAGLGQFLLFGVVDRAAKDAVGSAAMDPSGPVPATIRRVREMGVEAVLHADLCFCEYTDHGHCGPLCDDPSVTVDNDATLTALGAQAVMLAEAGADFVAPSGMMDGMVGTIRHALDGARHVNTGIMSYSVKYASGLYGPFRDAGEGAPQHGDRRGYQMDFRRSREWRTELALDVAEGADMVIVKPALAYLDVIAGARAATDLPIVGYHVSGEYSMIHAAAERGWCDLRSVAMEHTTAIRRAGADMVISYFAEQMLDWV